MSEKLFEMMNKGISMELQVSIQYLWQHVQWSGVKGFAANEKFKEIANEEREHSEEIAERLFYLGEKPVTKPALVTVGENLEDMLKLDIKAEKETIDLYKEIIRLAEEEDDITTAHLFRHILQEEEEHHDIFTTLIEDQEITPPGRLISKHIAR
jgi:bacterioferritin